MNPEDLKKLHANILNVPTDELSKYWAVEIRIKILINLYVGMGEKFDEIIIKLEIEICMTTNLHVFK